MRRKSLCMCFFFLLSIYNLSAQSKIEKATEDIEKGNITTHIIPMVADVWGEIDGWVKSPYATIYPSHWSKNKSVLSDGDSFIQIAAVRISSRIQREETERTFSHRDTHRGIASSHGGEYVSSAYFTTRQGYQAVRITIKLRKGTDMAYMDVYFVRAGRNMLITATSAVAGDTERTLIPLYEKYRKVFDYMIYSINKR